MAQRNYHLDYDSDETDSDDLTEQFHNLSLANNSRRRGGRKRAVPHGNFYSKKKLRRLYEKAEVYVRNKSSRMRPCRALYRDKPRDYFHDIIHDNRSIMEPYTKDFHGDPMSPANGRIQGLFFTANVLRKTGCPPESSIYGERRFSISPHRVMDIAPNAYFTDFYCVSKGIHYVTIVLTSPGSKSDRFCDHLIPFDIENNPFFREESDPYTGTSQFLVTDGVWVEILFTESLNLTEEVRTGAVWSNVVMTGRRSGGNTGFEKDSSCKDCNL